MRGHMELQYGDEEDTWAKAPKECLWYEEYTRRQKGAVRTRYAMRQFEGRRPRDRA